jgi:hypothetical protein
VLQLLVLLLKATSGIIPCFQQLLQRVVDVVGMATQRVKPVAQVDLAAAAVRH